MAKKLPKINDNNKKQGIETASGNSMIITSFITALGTLLTGQTTINDPSKLIGQIKGKGTPKSQNVGILGLLSKLNENIDVVIGGVNKDIFKDYWTYSNKNQKFLSENVLTVDFTNKIKDIPLILKDVKIGINSIFETLKNNFHDGGSESSDNKIKVSGGSDFAAILEALKDFTYDKKTRSSLEQLAKDTSKNGSIGQLFANINDINEMNVDVDKFKKNLDKINETNNSTAKAVGSQNTTDDLTEASKNLEGFKDFILGVIGISLLFIVVGLLVDKIDFVGLIKFAGILLLFVTSLAGVYILASFLMKKDGKVMQGMDAYVGLVTASAFILLVGGLLMRFIDTKSLMLFTLTLSVFLWELLSPFRRFSEYLGGQEVKDLDEVYEAISKVIIVSSFVMIFGSMAIKYIKFADLVLFTLTLSAFLFSVLGVFALVSKWYGNEGKDSMKDAFILIAGATFLMFLGAAVIPMLNIKNLIKFTVVLGMFLFVTLGVITLASKIFKAEGKGAYKDALFLIVGSAFLMFLGAAIIQHIETKYLFLFTITLGLFLTAVMLPFLIIRPMIEHVKSAALGVTLIVGMSAAILLIGGGLFMKYPDLPENVIIFGGILTVFMIAMWGIIKLLSNIKSSNLKKATIAMAGISATLLIITGSFLLIADVIKRIDGVGGMEKFKETVWLSMKVLGILSVGIAILAGVLGFAPMNVAAKIAIALVLSATAAFGIITLSFLGIATALEKLSKIKAFDVSPLINAVQGLIGLMGAMTPIIPFAIPLLFVESVMMKLADVMEKMARTVKDYADLKIGIYSGTKLVGYRHLKQSDFTEASNNISLIVTTLTEGIMKAYDAHKDWYGAGFDAFLNVFKGGSPLVRVIRQSKMLAPLISKLAHAVKGYADLKIGIYSGTKLVGYRHLDKTDFEKASTNVALVVTTLSEGIMKAYKDHEEWYGSKIFGALGDAFRGGTPLERVINQSSKLSKLISKIGGAVGSISKLKIADEWDSKTGDAKHYRLLTPNDFKLASANTNKVITTLSYAVMDVYKENENWYNGSWFGLGDSPLEKVIKTNIKLSKLISEVASSIKDYAKLKMPTKFDENGKPKGYEVMKEQHFIDASSNIGLLLTILGESIMLIYNDPQKKGWYDGSWFGLGNSPFEKVIKTNTKLSNLISTVAANIKDYADLKIPKFDSKGKIIGYDKMERKHFIEAGTNISRVLTATALGLLGYTVDENGNTKQINGYEEYKKIFEDKKGKKQFERILDISVKMSSVISEMAKGISNFSKMRFPKRFNDKGQAIEYHELKTTDFETAAACITTVISTVATALLKLSEGKNTNGEVINGLKEIWDVKNFEKSPLYNILKASEKMGQGISGIAKSLSEYASMKFPTGYDKNGNATGYKKLSETDLKTATEKITDVITLVAKTIAGLYEGKGSNGEVIPGLKELWETKTNFLNIGGEPTTPFEKILNSCVLMGQMIESIAKGISMYASGNIGTEENPVKINDTTLSLARNSITDVLSNSATTIADLSKNTTFFEKDNEDVEKIINNLSKVTELISSSAKNVQMFASLQIPDKWDSKTGKPIHYIQMSEPHFNEASKNIKTVMTTIAEAFNESISKSDWINDIDDNPFSGLFFGNKPKKTSSTINNAMNAIMTMASTLSIMAGCIYGYATMTFPKGIDKNGNMIYSEKLSYTDIDIAKEHIIKIINSLGDAMNGSLENVNKYKNEDVELVNDFVTSVTGTITEILKSVEDMTKSDTVTNISTTINNLDILRKNLGSITSGLSKLLYILFEEQIGQKSTTDKNGNLDVAFLSFVGLIKEYYPIFEGASQKIDNFIDSLSSIISSIGKLNEPFTNSLNNINSLYDLFSNDYVYKVDTIIFSMGQLLNSIKSIMNFDSMLVDENDKTDYTLFPWLNNDFIPDTEKSQNEISNIIDRLKDYSELIIAVTDTFKKINDNIADVKLDNYANFSMLTHFILELNVSLSTVNTKSLRNFSQQATQLDKFVKTVNSIKLSNLTNLNKFVNSLNQLANRMGNLDRLTDAIANKLSKVLEKLVERLVSAETTIVKADEIQKRRHQLIEKSVKEVSELMKQPMTVEIKQVDNPEPEDEDKENQ